MLCRNNKDQKYTTQSACQHFILGTIQYQMIESVSTMKKGILYFNTSHHT